MLLFFPQPDKQDKHQDDGEGQHQGHNNLRRHFFEQDKHKKGDDPQIDGPEADKTKKVKDDALSQTASIADLYSVMDEVSEFARQNRLTMQKLTKDRKIERKKEIAAAGQEDLNKHYSECSKDLRGYSIPPLDFDFEKVS